MMKQIIIEVEDDEVDFIMELLSKLDFVKAEIFDELSEENAHFIKVPLQQHLDDEDDAVS